MVKSREIKNVFIEESMNSSVAQKECYCNLRRFFLKNHGKDSPIIEVIDILHHPSMEYRKRRLKGSQNHLVKMSPMDIWEIAQVANIAKDFHRDFGNELFIPNAYFYDLKAFFINLVLIPMLYGGEFSHVNKSLFTVKNKECLLSFKTQKQEENDSNIFLIDLNKNVFISTQELMKFSGGLHIFPTELDEGVSRKILEMVKGWTFRAQS